MIKLRPGHAPDCPGCTSKPGDGARRLYHHEEVTPKPLVPIVARGHKPDCRGCLGGAAFHTLTPEFMTELLRKGVRDADELDKRLRRLFTLDAAARNFVLR
jgi:hypothetical protein